MKTKKALKKSKKTKKSLVKKKVIKRKPKVVSKSRKAKKIWQPHLDQMKKKLDIALKKLQKDVKNKAPFNVIEKDNNEILLLLGECNYYVREFHRTIKSK